MKASVPILLIVCLAAGAPGCRSEVSVPPQLRGTWTTSAPGFERIAMEFSEHVVMFDLADEGVNAHSILSLEAEPMDRGRTLYSLEYRDAQGEKWPLVFIHDPAGGGTLQLKNRSEIWERTHET